jgi:hypothetical protein
MPRYKPCGSPPPLGAPPELEPPELPLEDPLLEEPLPPEELLLLLEPLPEPELLVPEPLLDELPPELLPPPLLDDPLLPELLEEPLLELLAPELPLDELLPVLLPPLAPLLDDPLLPEPPDELPLPDPVPPELLEVAPEDPPLTPELLLDELLAPVPLLPPELAPLLELVLPEELLEPPELLEPLEALPGTPVLLPQAVSVKTARLNKVFFIKLGPDVRLVSTEDREAVLQRELLERLPLGDVFGTPRRGGGAGRQAVGCADHAKRTAGHTEGRRGHLWRGKVERLGDVIGLRIAHGKRIQPPTPFDHLENRSMVILSVRNVTAPGVR